MILSAISLIGLGWVTNWKEAETTQEGLQGGAKESRKD